MGEVDWAGRMARLPDEDLIEIASSGDTDGFESEAVEAATAELERRKPDVEIIADVQQAVRSKNAAREGRSIEPLSNPAWVAFVFFGPFFLFTIPAIIMLATMGYYQKAKDAGWAILLSFLFWGMISAAMALFLG
ncbi:hypothetical protein [Sphingopyxis macrogoltabida]|nr:hypothetical protein [Sphingopyxis macrogoltabida]